MAQAAYTFDDADAYDRYMGQWSKAAGRVFLDWVQAPAGADWLDVGCGTGIFTSLVLECSSPRNVVAVDPSTSQIEQACRSWAAERVRFEVADARALPYADASFDVIASSLALNFIPDRKKALSEFCRVARRGGIVAGFV